jgi:lipoprotein-anchoring transpeptidase ErfK/SrfK
MRKFPLVAASCLMLLVTPNEAGAQNWPAWAQNAFGQHRAYADRDPPDNQPPAPKPRVRPTAQASKSESRDGGPRPHIAAVAPPIVAFAHEYPANSIVIDTGGRKLYFVLGDHRAYAYPISVGKQGFSWTGTEVVSRKQAWPDWYPPSEMRERDPSLPEKMSGGLRNPLGAMALYLGNTLYRIHGTNDIKSIGHAASSGCFRMLNSAVLHLASIADVGTPVTVVSSLPAEQQISRAPDQPAPDGSQPQAPAQSAQPQSRPERVETHGTQAQVQDYRALREQMLEPR